MTQGEANSIQDDVGSMTYYLIPNPFTFDVHRESNGRTGLLSVGRIEPRKNQLTLVRALRDTDLPLTVIGVPNRNHPAYLRAFYREVRRSRNVTYIPGLPQAELKRFYRNAKVHISLSWFEVVSQVDLEAIANGCAVVASRWGHVNEYVEEDLWQVDPIAVHNDVEAVRQIAQQAHDGARPLTIRNVMKWSWDDVTDELLNAYKAILDAGEIRA